MKVLVYPADETGCGYHRLIWPTEVLRAAGHDVEVVAPRRRELSIQMRRDGSVAHVDLPPDIDVVVFQRITHGWLANVVDALRERDVAVVIDVDDDLTSIHPGNAAFQALHPSRVGTHDSATGRPHMHSWNHLTEACKKATLVTVSTPTLLKKYAVHGRGYVLRNYLADHYYGVRHVDSDTFGWPASLHTHPNDPDALGNAVSRLVSDGFRFGVIGDPTGVGHAFRLDSDPVGSGVVDLLDWPTAIAHLGVGIIPLADTKFNDAKSWLKGLELSAVGVPWLASPRREYVQLHGLGAGLLVDRPRGWYAQIKRLLVSSSWRTELAERGRVAASELRLRDNAWRWLEAWEHALTIQRGNLVPPLR